ncbi:GntR family transcriptional regulator [Anaerocolumna sedimenticola]|uniref:GntR family transcriptional regulator n=1 Tax=Anaerocolumna sedimenticola TaxID=2696063 RepID=A0A6P1TF10_9FIRM|nr:GntR family transcriptional regulator [Anaerocolumna sedimenticola]QHQ59780.1 GntR family transcriptional regulator [Anaerocolumna sedimenticola]
MRNEFLYKQVYEGIRGKILDGTFSKGSKLPSEEEFCTKYEVSTITIKKAMNLLVDDGMVHRVPGKGTYVMGDTICNQELSKVEDNEKMQICDNPNMENELKGVGPKGKKRKIIGLVLEHVASPFGLDMMYQLDREAENAGYKLCIRFSYGNREKETDEIDYLLSLNVEGLIIMPCHGAHYNTAILKLIIENFPVILIDKRMNGIPVTTVSTDGKNAIKSLVKHLYERGCRNIGLITVDAKGTSSLIDRREGFYIGIEEVELTAAEECVLTHDHTNFIDKKTEQADTECIYQYFKKAGGTLDGVVCTEYGMMSSVVQASKRLAIKIGKDLKVCCIDEDYQASDGYYFTHMKQNERSIAELAIKLFIQDKIHPAIDYVVPAIFNQGKTT